MHPFFYIFGIRIPAFGTMLALAGVVSFTILRIRGRRKDFASDDTFNYFIMCILGGVGGAFLLHVFLALPKLIADWKDLIAPLSFTAALPVILGQLNGLVFYGGLIGAVIAVLLYSKLAKVPLMQYADLIAPVIPIAHAIGRVGCLLGGCCYGIEVTHGHPFGIIYPDASLGAPPGVLLLAAPPIESCCNLLIAIVLFLFARKQRAPGRILALYALLYAPARFILEFFRGDAIRGVYRGVSTSQFISIALFIGGALLFAFAPKLKGRADNAWEEYERELALRAELKAQWDETHRK
jgi:phosphatidylglycerol:prolipoprotein diacylglycerol transferase